MAIFKRQKPKEKRSGTFFVNAADFDDLCTSEYTSLDKCPEIMTACRRIADMVSSMTIYLMANTEKGDIRVKNELSRKVDILPSEWMTRKTWMDFIVMNMLLYGNGNAVVYPHTQNGMLGDLEPIPRSRYSIMDKGSGYEIIIDGKPYNPSDLLHFVLNPDPNQPWRGIGLTTTLKALAHNLKQATETETGFMSSQYKPNLIVKVDALVDEFASPEGRERLLDEYFKTAKAGQPWLIPAEQFSVEQVKPLSLNDLAISSVVELDKKTVASILGVPAFVLGVGSYTSTEWNGFISNTIRPIAEEIEQELTRKLLISTKMYWKFNMASLYGYDIKTTSDVYSNLFVRGIVTGNEVRDKMNLQPLEGLDDLVILENYIPLGKIGDQIKLGGGSEDEGL